jgi:hypothetical protein
MRTECCNRRQYREDNAISFALQSVWTGRLQVHHDAGYHWISTMEADANRLDPILSNWDLTFSRASGDTGELQH